MHSPNCIHGVEVISPTNDEFMIYLAYFGTIVIFFFYIIIPKDKFQEIPNISDIAINPAK